MDLHGTWVIRKRIKRRTNHRNFVSMYKILKVFCVGWKYLVHRNFRVHLLHEKRWSTQKIFNTQWICMEPGSFESAFKAALTTEISFQCTWYCRFFVYIENFMVLKNTVIPNAFAKNLCHIFKNEKAHYPHKFHYNVQYIKDFCVDRIFHGTN